MTSLLQNPARYSFSHKVFRVIETPKLEDFARISDSDAIQRYVSRTGATIRFQVVNADGSIADPVTIEVRSGATVLLAPDPQNPGDMILSIPASAIEGACDDESDFEE